MTQNHGSMLPSWSSVPCLPSSKAFYRYLATASITSRPHRLPSEVSGIRKLLIRAFTPRYVRAGIATQYWYAIGPFADRVYMLHNPKDSGTCPFNLHTIPRHTQPPSPQYIITAIKTGPPLTTHKLGKTQPVRKRHRGA